jgi:TetR/AcrR family transcriptional regulator, fatty acid metabolism regulator protein
MKSERFARKPATSLDSPTVSEGSKVQEERRRQILQAAVRAFARRGYHACRVSDIAKEAGVAYGLVYHYYKSKETLLEAIFEETWGAMLTTIRSVEALDEPAREQVRKVTEIVLRTWKRDPELVRVLVREVTRSSQVQQETDEIDLAYQALQRIVEHGQQSGEFRDDVDARLTSTIWYGALEEILTGWAFGQLPDTEADVTRAERAVVEIVTGGLAADRAATPA